MSRILILGAGFGGLSVATELRALLGSEHEIVLIDQQDRFVMGLRKLWDLVDYRSLAEGSRTRERLKVDGVSYLHRTITAIDPGARRIETNAGSLAGDYLVIALGAQLRPDLVPGLAEHAHNFYDVGAIPAARRALEELRSGRIAIVIAGAPYQCPPAPYECAMLVDEYLREQGRRDQVEMTVVTMQPMLLPNAGQEGSAWIGGQLRQRDIEYHVKQKLQKVDPGHLQFEDLELDADLILAVPPHDVPAVVKESGLTGEGQWVSVDPGTLATSFANVYAIGDVTMIKLANGLPLPKAGLVAELEGERVAAHIAAQIRGDAEPAAFDGRAFCFLELGKDTATLIQGDFYATPAPKVEILSVSADNAQDKRRFESERLARWFLLQ